MLKKILLSLAALLAVAAVMQAQAVRTYEQRTTIRYQVSKISAF